MELNNQEFIVVLHIAEGTGFFNCAELIMISASLGGTKLETEAVLAGKNTTFCSNLIWETDKIAFKKMETDNLPVKIECYSIIIKNGEEMRSLIGYILIPIRGIPILAQENLYSVKTYWHKLIGLNSQWRSNNPAILLHLTIIMKQNFGRQANISLENHGKLKNAESTPFETYNTANMLTTQNGLFIKLLQDEGLLQIGDFERNCDVFILKLMFKNARNLEHIIYPEEKPNSLFRFHYNLLGSQTYCSLVPKGTGLYSIQEKIAIHFRSSLQSLKEYFQKILLIPIDLYYKDIVVGQAQFRFHSLLYTDNLNEFLEVFAETDNTHESGGCFHIQTLFDLPPMTPKPTVEYELSLKYLSTTKISNCEVIVDQKEMIMCIDSQSVENSDQQYVDIDHISANKQKFNDIILSEQTKSNFDRGKVCGNESGEEYYLLKNTKSNTAIHNNNSNIKSILVHKNDIKNIHNIPITFSFNLKLQTVKFTRRPETGIFQISFHHMKANTPFTMANLELTEISSNTIELNNFELQLFFVSNVNDIITLIASEPCIIKINGPCGMNATAKLDNKMLLLGINEEKIGTILMENQSGEKIALAHILVHLDDIGININNKVRKHGRIIPELKPYMDNNLARKIVEELEEWKVKQQGIFLVELKRKEIQHLSHFLSKWQLQKIEQETNLAKKLQQCTTFAAVLDEAHKLLKEKGIHHLKEEKHIEKTILEFEEIYSITLVELKENAKRLEHDMGHKLRLLEFKYYELGMSKSIVDHENRVLKQEVSKLQENIEMEKEFLPRKQLAELLQDFRILSERFDEVLKSKCFYKNQWANIIREVHKIKSECNRHIELQLKQQKSFNVQDYLNSE